MQRIRDSQRVPLTVPGVYSGARRAFSALTLGALGGCFLPIHYTEAGSPIVVGEYRGPDGLPVAGASVAVTHDYDDLTCAKAAAGATTDDRGAFRLPSTTIQRRWLLLIPPIEKFANSYRLCIGAPDSLRPAYGGPVALNARQAQIDSLACFAWTLEGRRRATCHRPGDRVIASGGAWSAGGESGWYRVVEVYDRWPHQQSRVYAQWVARSTASASDSVRATLDLTPLSGLASVGEPALVLEGARWRVRALGAKRPYGAQETRLIYELGGPGEARLVEKR
jgi:hypothetical protein